MSIKEQRDSICKKKWKNTWSFNLHTKVPLRILQNIRDTPMLRMKFRRLMKKYYGKRIQYIDRVRDLNFFVSRSKFLRYIAIEEGQLSKNSLRTKGNLVILGTSVDFQRSQWKNKGFISFKKIFKHCQRAHIRTKNGQNLRLLKYMLALRNLNIEIATTFKVDSLEGSFRNCLNLETIKVEYMTGENITRKNKMKSQRSNKRFFSELHKLDRLQRVKFISNYEVLKDMEQDVEKFYQKPLSFDFCLKIHCGVTFISRKEEYSSLGKILNAAEYLSIEDPQNPRSIFDGYSLNLTKKAKTNLHKRNVVEISIMALKSSGSLFSLFCLIKKKCQSLRHFSLYLSTLLYNEKDRTWSLWDDGSDSLFKGGRKVARKETPMCDSALREGLKVALEEISTFDKLKVFGLLIAPEDLDDIPLGKILSNKNLEVLKLKFSYRTEIIASLEWDKCFVTTRKSQIKELYVKIPKRIKVPLFGISLFDYIQKLECLEVVELIDENLEVVMFDFLYGFVTSLLEKKSMRRILICTKVVNNFSLEHFGKLLSKSLGDQLTKMLNEISQDWETRVKTLKELQLEEILIGKLSGYSFDYLLFNKEAEVPEKLFWTGEEIEELLSSKKGMAGRYKRVFDLFRGKDTAV